MPKNRVHKRKMFREFVPTKKDLLAHTGLEYILPAYRYCKKEYDLNQGQIFLLLFCYSLEFFTMDYASRQMGLSRQLFGRRFVYPLVTAGYLYKHFDRLAPAGMEELMFREETAYQYKVRYAISQKGRMFVTRFYRMCAGKEPMNAKQ